MNEGNTSGISNDAAEVAAATIATGAGLAIGGSMGALAGAAATPMLTRAVLMLSDRVQRLRHQRTAEVLTELASLLDVTEVDLTRLLTSDERVLELTTRVVQAAQDLSSASKRMALCRALAMAASDPTPARLDICELLHAAILGVDAPHIRFMYVIEDAQALPTSANRAPDGQQYGMSLQQVFKRDPGLEEGGHAILQNLLSMGLVESCARGMGFMADRDKPHALSGLGRRLLELLREEGSQDRP